jgi:hypothetical protein
VDEVLKKIAPRRREFLNYLLGTALGAPIFVARDSAWAQVAPSLTPMTTISPPRPLPSSVVTPTPTATSIPTVVSTPTPTGTPKPTHMHTPRPTPRPTPTAHRSHDHDPTHMHTPRPTPRPPKNIRPTPTAYRSHDHDPTPVNPSNHPKGRP